MNEQIKQEQIQCEYTCLQKVKINRGFYKGQLGIIKTVFKKNKDIYYTIQIIINDKIIVIELDEESIEPYNLKFKIPFLN